MRLEEALEQAGIAHRLGTRGCTPVLYTVYIHHEQTRLNVQEHFGWWRTTGSWRHYHHGDKAAALQSCAQDAERAGYTIEVCDDWHTMFPFSFETVGSTTTQKEAIR